MLVEVQNIAKDGPWFNLTMNSFTTKKNYKTRIMKFKIDDKIQIMSYNEALKQDVEPNPTYAFWGENGIITNIEYKYNIHVKLNNGKTTVVDISFIKSIYENIPMEKL